MYDEGFNEATVLMLRGVDLLAEAYRRLKSTHGKELGAEIAGAMHARKAAQQTQAAPSPDYGTKEVPFGSFDPGMCATFGPSGSFAVDEMRDWIPVEDPSCCVFVDTAGVGKVVLESLQRLGVKARPLPKFAPPLLGSERRELHRWRALFSRPDICARELAGLRESNGVLGRALDRVQKKIAGALEHYESHSHRCDAMNSMAEKLR